jgi:hypothetical protein
MNKEKLTLVILAAGMGAAMGLETNRYVYTIRVYHY